MITAKIKELRALISAIAGLIVVIILLVILPAVLLRMFGMPSSWMTVPSGELVSYGVFLFCAAYALSR